MGKTEWPSREEWARRERTYYGDEDLRVSKSLADYASPEEIAAAIAEAKALWTEMGRQMKAAGSHISDAEWRKRYMAAADRDRESKEFSTSERDAVLETPEFRRLELRDERSNLNRHVIKTMCAGYVPLHSNGFDLKRLPKVAELEERYWEAWNAALEAKKAEYAARPVDDAAWESELKRRARVEAWLGGERFVHKVA